ncbi:MAG: hypothetical protein IBJ15_00015 [Alphaproteobacteria bacterium]|nr:hypothetical protein [Alphaproteobacteria bacterium]
MAKVNRAGAAKIIDEPSAVDHAKVAAKAYANVQVFGLISKIVEGGDIVSASHSRGADLIVSICNAEIAKAIDEYDTALAAVEKVAT